MASPALGAPYIQQSQRYIDCTVSSRANPAQALERANQWVNAESSNASALHCKALAEYALKHYEQAAATLTVLNSLLKNDQISLKANVLLQAAHAYRMNKQPVNAADALTDAVTLSSQHGLDPLSVALLHERASLYEVTQQPHKSIQDLDHILSLAPADTRALLARAKLFAIMGKDELAQDDYAEILRLEPANTEASQAINRAH